MRCACSKQETGKLTLPRARGNGVVVLGPARYPEGWSGNDEWTREQNSKIMASAAGLCLFCVFMSQRCTVCLVSLVQRRVLVEGLWSWIGG